MIKRLLIANRGEIASRIIRSCNALGIETISVFAASDRHARYVEESNYSVEFPRQAGENPYVSQEHILEIAQSNRACAIHPGYGFLSENADFAEAVREAGIIFIGPKADTIRSIGDKAAARELANSLNIPTLSGITISSEDTSLAIKQCESIGYPLMLKATGAGGGRAMRKVHQESDFIGALSQVKNEASLFGKGGEIIAERLLESARHIEVQLCGFQNGTVIHLGERDCSAQRRYQKLIEESPALDLSKQLRDKLFRDAVRLAKEANLLNLATAEFLCLDEEYFFLEVNPRLQVEHPVTEAVCNRDLVEIQIQTASDPNYFISQDQISFSGAATEVRIVAESPEQNYSPSARKVRFFSLPESARIDHSLKLNLAPNLAFDSLLAKVICQGDNILESRAATRRSLESLCIIGPATTAPFLLETLRWEKPFTTDYLSLQHENLIGVDSRNLANLAAYSITAAYLLQSNPFTSNGKGSAFGQFPLHGHLQIHLQKRTFKHNISSDSVQVDDAITTNVISLSPDTSGNDILTLEINSARAEIELLADSENRSNDDPRICELLIKLDQKCFQSRVFCNMDAGETGIVWIAGHCFEAEKYLPATKNNLSVNKETTICSPLPGTITAVNIQAGDTVETNQTLFVIESMKMEHTIQAKHPAQISQLLTAVGSLVQKGEVLAQLAEATCSDSSKTS